MSIARLALAYGAALVTFLAVDSVWLKATSTRLYRAHLGDLMATQVRIAPAIIFYALYVAGIVYFAVAPALRAGSATRALIPAALMALVAYGTYDLTNQATLRRWPTIITLADMGWGMFATIVASLASYFVVRALLK